jgi:hypothetical protein
MILLGASLTIGAISVVVLTVVSVSRSGSPGIAEVVMLLIVIAICAPLAAFGAMHIRRALKGRN